MHKWKFDVLVSVIVIGVGTGASAFAEPSLPVSDLVFRGDQPETYESSKQRIDDVQEFTKLMFKPSRCQQSEGLMKRTIADTFRSVQYQNKSAAFKKVLSANSLDQLEICSEYNVWIKVISRDLKDRVPPRAMFCRSRLDYFLVNFGQSLSKITDSEKGQILRYVNDVNLKFETRLFDSLTSRGVSQLSESQILEIQEIASEILVFRRLAESLSASNETNSNFKH